MSTDLQTRFSELKETIETEKISKARLEANLETYEKQLIENTKQLEQLTGTTDMKEIQALEKELEARIEALTQEADKLLTEAEL